MDLCEKKFTEYTSRAFSPFKSECIVFVNDYKISLQDVIGTRNKNGVVCNSPRHFTIKVEGIICAILLFSPPFRPHD